MTVPTAGALGRPISIELQGVLYLRAPSPHSRTKLSEILSHAGFDYEVRPTILGVYVRENGLEEIVNSLMKRLSAVEAAATMAVYQERGEQAGVELLFSAVPLSVMHRRASLPEFIHALQHDGAQTWFQPIVCPQTPDKPFAYEALTRVQTEQGLLSGYDVFELAQAADILMSVDRIARMNAVRAARNHGISECLFLNLNPGSVHDPVYGLESFIRRVEAAGIKLSNLCFEIVESERLFEPDHVRALVEEHREKGCKFALDDLGAGYSSLNLLHRLRPDFVKIDMDLVRGIDMDKYKQTIVRHVIDAAKSLDIETIGEGVETREEFEWLTNAGIDYLQGYYIARPAFNPPLRSLSS